MTPPLRIAIVGYGIGGISAAMHLRRQGHCITHFDRHEPPSSAGAGMLLHPPAQRELAALGILEQAQECGAPVRGIHAQTTRGCPLFEMGYADFANGQFGLGIQRGTLHQLLSSADAGREAVMVGRNMTLADSHEGYLLDDLGGRHGPYDLVVVADGAESSLRAHGPFTTYRNQRAPTAALVGLIDDNDDVASDRLVQRFDRGSHVSVWPVGSSSPGGVRRCSFAMNVAVADASDFRERGLWNKRLAGFFPELGQALHDQVPALHPYVFTYRDVEVTSYAKDRIVLIGDAAHSMSPQLGIGAQLAMADARVLATKLATHDSVGAALHAYSRARPIQIRRYQQASRWLTPVLQSESRLMGGLRNGVLSAAMRSPLARQVAQGLLS